MARPTLSGWRLAATTVGPVIVLAAIVAVQWWVTTPGVTTYTEFRLTLLAGGALMPIVLCAAWIDAAPRKVDPRRARRR